MCESDEHTDKGNKGIGSKVIPVDQAVGTILSHDITEIRPGDFKGRAFKKGHIVREEDITHLKRLGKENLVILEINEDEMHENDAADAMAKALAGSGVKMAGEANEGKINLVAEQDGILKVDSKTLLKFNMLGEVMCATIHNNTVVKEGRTLAGTRAIPLVVKKSTVEEAVRIAENVNGVLSVKPLNKPNAGVVITGNEVYHGRIKDAFEPVIRKKVQSVGGKVVAVHFAPDNAEFIEAKIRELIKDGADLIITTGGMSVDPDDVTRFAIRNAGAEEIYYGSPVLPGSMFLVGYLSTEAGKKRSGEDKSDSTHKSIPVLGIPACGMYADITVFDLVLPRILAGEKIGREEIAELGHGGLCLKCEKCQYPVCPFGK